MISNKLIFLSLFLLLCLLFVATFVACAKQCNESIPTMDVLLKYPLVIPYFISGVNVWFIIHFMISKTLLDRFRNISILVASVCVYASSVMTLFIFPMSGWDYDYGSFLVLLSFLGWNVVVIWKVLNAEDRVVLILMTTFLSVSIIIYGVLRLFFPGELSGILVLEIFIGLIETLALVFVILKIPELQ